MNDSPKLFISMQNSKTGPSFNLTAGASCPGKTDICAALCYADKGRMGLPFQKARREGNFRDVIQLLKEDMTGTRLVWALDRAIKRAKVSTLRIHDSGDFFSAVYIRSWAEVIRRNPQVRFWAYTRSFSVANLLAPLVQLCELQNVSLWISADVENWQLAFSTYLNWQLAFSGIAWMQTEGSEQVALIIQRRIGVAHFVNFPVHGARTGSKNLVTHNQELRSCPVTTGKLLPDWRDPPCARCNWCLPVAVLARAASNG